MTDYTRIIKKLFPEKERDGFGSLVLRAMVVSAVNGDGTLDLTTGGVTIPDVPYLGSSLAVVGTSVQVLVARGQLLALGATGDADSPPYGIGVLNRSKTTSDTSAVTTTETKDTQIGNIGFTAVSGRRYQVSFSCRTSASANATTMDIRIRDGGAGSPTSASTILTAGSQYVVVSGGAGQNQFTVFQTLDCPGDIAAGAHTIAPFYVRTAGTGSVFLSRANNQARELKIEDVGPIRP